MNNHVNPFILTENRKSVLARRKARHTAWASLMKRERLARKHGLQPLSSAEVRRLIAESGITPTRLPPGCHSGHTPKVLGDII